MYSKRSLSRKRACRLQLDPGGEDWSANTLAASRIVLRVLLSISLVIAAGAERRI